MSATPLVWAHTPTTVPHARQRLGAHERGPMAANRQEPDVHAWERCLGMRAGNVTDTPEGRMGGSSTSSGVGCCHCTPQATVYRPIPQPLPSPRHVHRSPDQHLAMAVGPRTSYEVPPRDAVVAAPRRTERAIGPHSAAAP